MGQLVRPTPAVDLDGDEADGNVLRDVDDVRTLRDGDGDAEDARRPGVVEVVVRVPVVVQGRQLLPGLVALLQHSVTADTGYVGRPEPRGST